MVAVGLAIRAWILASPLGRLDSDEAVVGLMARHILDGEVNAFFWGQAYGGTLDQLLTAGVFALVGPSVLALKLVQVGLAAVACVLTWRVGRHIVGEGPARVAGLLLWIAPAAYLVYSTKSRGWYWVGLCLVLGLVLVGRRLVDRPDWRGMAWFGLLLGLAWWTSPALLFLAGPTAVYVVVRRPALVRLAWAGTPTFLVGAAPWIRYNLLNDLASLEQSPPPAVSSYGERLAGFFTDGLPKALGLQVPYEGGWLAGPVGVAVYGLALTGFVYLLIRRPRHLAPILFLGLAYPLAFAVPSSTVYVDEPRYVLFLAPVLALLVAVGLTTWRRQMAALGLALAASVAGLATMSSWSESNPLARDLAPSDLGPVLAVLAGHDVDAVWAGYWTSYRLSFESDERVIAASTGHVRYRPHQATVRQDGAPGFVVPHDSHSGRTLGPALSEKGIEFAVVAAGDFVVYLPERAVDPAELSSVWPP